MTTLSCASFPDLVSLQGRLANELKISFGYSPAIATAIAQTADSVYRGETSIVQPGMTAYSAVRLSEPSGKPLDFCRRADLRLTTWQKSDDSISDMKARKMVVLARICQEAYDQDGVLTIEDCSRVLLCSKRSIKEYVSELRVRGIYLPLRGYVHSTGRGQTHKTEIICLYLEGMQFTDIMRRTYHSSEAISRYLSYFSKVVICHAKQGMATNDIARVVNVSEDLVKEYVKLYEIYAGQGNDRLDSILDPAQFENLVLPLKKKMVLA